MGLKASFHGLSLGLVASVAFSSVAAQTPVSATPGFSRASLAPDYFSKNHCLTAQAADENSGLKVSESMRAIRDSETLTGQAIFKYMQAADIWYCERPIDNPPGVWAFSQSLQGVVTFNSNKLQYRLIAVMAHETLHLMQSAQGCGSIVPQTSDIYSVQALTLTQEATAHAAEVMYAFELRQAGDDRAWQGLSAPLLYTDKTKRPSPYLGMMEVFSSRYAEEMSIQTPRLAALERAGAALVDFFIGAENPKRDIYNQNILAAYIARIAAGVYYEGAGQDTIDLEKLRQCGKIADDLNLTRGFALPGIKSRFDSDAKMRHAFAAVELYRLAKNAGENDMRYLAGRMAAAAENNPYADVDFAAVARKMPQAFFGVTDRPVLEIIDQAARDQQRPKP